MADRPKDRKFSEEDEAKEREALGRYNRLQDTVTRTLNMTCCNCCSTSR